MKEQHLLNLGNPRKVIKILSGLLDPVAIDRVEQEIERNVAQLLGLARSHYRFAARQTNPHWRQKVSRLYYAGYNAARALRLYIYGEYSIDVTDHQKFDRIPENFPRRSTYSNQLEILRADRNTCDYDHLSTASDLVLGSRDAEKLVCEFIDDVIIYLRENGFKE